MGEECSDCVQIKIVENPCINGGNFYMTWQHRGLVGGHLQRVALCEDDLCN